MKDGGEVCAVPGREGIGRAGDESRGRRSESQRRELGVVADGESTYKGDCDVIVEYEDGVGANEGQREDPPALTERRGQRELWL